MNLPQRQPLEIGSVAYWIKPGLSRAGAGHMTAVKKQLACDLHRMRLKKSRVVRRVEQVPRRRPVVRNNLGHDRATHRSFVRILGQSSVNVVESAAKQVALDTLAVSFRQRLVLVNV